MSLPWLVAQLLHPIKFPRLGSNSATRQCVAWGQDRALPLAQHCSEDAGVTKNHLNDTCIRVRETEKRNKRDLQAQETKGHVRSYATPRLATVWRCWSGTALMPVATDSKGQSPERLAHQPAGSSVPGSLSTCLSKATFPLPLHCVGEQDPLDLDSRQRKTPCAFWESQVSA